MATKKGKPKYTPRAMRNKRIKIGSPMFIILIIVAIVTLICSMVDKTQEKKADSTPQEIPTTPAKNNNSLNTRPSELMKVVGNEHLPSVTADYTGFTVNFNPQLHIPNYVAWELTADEIIGENTSNNFWQDRDVEGCPAVTNYRSSGYDKGHMCPAADMKWSADARNHCYSMVNMAPQVHDLNAGAWKSVEEKCRARVTPDSDGAHRDSALIIICGPVPNEAPAAFIGPDNVAVPQQFFKVILAPFARDPYAIGFIMPNAKVKGGMQQAAVTIDKVEEITGYDFFSALPDSIESRIESTINFEKWSRLK